MPILTTNCPYCGTKHVCFTAIKSVKNPLKSYEWNVFLTCGACWLGVVALVSDNGTGFDPMNHPGELSQMVANGGYRLNVMEVFPRVAETVVPAFLPSSVAKSFLEGCEVLSRSPDAACSMFRKALELGLKDLSPDIEAWKLEKRIDKMADANLLTPAIKEWAHHLRLDGNGAIHESGETTKQFAKEMENLTRFVLTYLYTLPGQISEARAKSANQ